MKLKNLLPDSLKKESKGLGDTIEKITEVTGIKKVVETIRDLINPNISINFNKKVNKGNPKYYCADIQKIENYGFKANKIFNQEIKNYVKWVKNLDD